jgi:NAD(P)H-dependent FMN reductase
MRLAIFSASTRKASINSALVSATIPRAKDAGFTVSRLDLADYDMPLYNGDWHDENGAPESAKALAKALSGFDAVICISPEYNGSLPPLLKNTIDWMTCLGDMSAFHNPIWVVGSCTPGPMSGIMVMRQMQFILTRVGTQVLQFHLGVGNAGAAFNKDGSLAQKRDQELTSKILGALKGRIR